MWPSNDRARRSAAGADQGVDSLHDPPAERALQHRWDRREDRHGVLRKLFDVRSHNPRTGLDGCVQPESEAGDVDPGRRLAIGEPQAPAPPTGVGRRRVFGFCTHRLR